MKTKIITTFITLIMSMFCSPAWAGVIYVDVNSTYSDSLTCGGDWLEACQELQWGIHRALSSDQIWVAAGTYYGNFVTGGESIYGGFSGNETLLTERDWNINKTTVDAMGGQYGIRPSSGSIIDGLHVTNGQSGIYVYMASPVIRNCSIFNNHGARQGGGIQVIVQNAASVPTIENCYIYGNSATIEGGGIYIGANYSGGVPLVINNVVYNNIAPVGAGITIRTSRVDLINNTVAYNEGSGVFMISFLTSNIINNLIVNNEFADLHMYAAFAGEIISIFNNNAYGSSNPYLGIEPQFIFSDNISDGPAFADTVEFNLNCDSSSIDAGTTTWVSPIASDIDGDSRILNGNEDCIQVVDIGAQEFQGHIKIDAILMSTAKLIGKTCGLADILAASNDVCHMPASCVTIDGHWTGLTNDYDIGTTDISGQLIFESDQLKHPAGEFCFNLDSVNKADYIFDEASSILSSCISVQ